MWQENTNIFPRPVVWANGLIANIDAHITSENFNILSNAELGIHLFYDRNAANELFLRDFAIRFDSFGSPYGGTQIQW